MEQPKPGQQQQQQQQAQPGAVYNDLATKKGFRTQDDFATNYTQLETDRSQKVNALATAKQQVEQQSNGSLTVDDKGNVIQNPGYQAPAQQQPSHYQQGGYQQPYQQQQPGYGQQQQPYGQPQQQEIYDLNGQLITNPLDAQLAQMPVSQRMGVMFNAMSDAREKQQTGAFTSEQEVLSKPEAKGFENDVRNIMMQLPLAQRSDKKQWEDALLRAKGVKFDVMRQNAGQEGVSQFLEKQGIQPIPAATGAPEAVVNAELTPEQEQSFQWYQKNNPSLFKDRAHFKKRLSNTGA